LLRNEPLIGVRGARQQQGSQAPGQVSEHVDLLHGLEKKRPDGAGGV